MAKKLSEGRKPGSGRKPGTAKTLAEGRKIGSGRKKGSGGKTIGKTLAEGRKAGSGRKKGSKGTPKSDNDNNSTHSDDSSLLNSLNDPGAVQGNGANHHNLLSAGTTNLHHQDLLGHPQHQQHQSLANYHPQIAQLSHLNGLQYITGQDPHQQHQHPQQHHHHHHQQQQQQQQPFPHLGNFAQHQPHQLVNQQANSGRIQTTDDRMKYNDIKLIMNDLNGKNTIENTILPFNRSRQE